MIETFFIKPYILTIMTDLRKLPKTFVLEFIELYRKSPCLWNLKNKKYFDRRLRKAAYEKLKIKLRELIPNATREMVVKKIDSIRGSFRNELKKVKESQNSELGKVAVYKPRLWYFEKLMFLKERGRKKSKKENEPKLKEVEEPDVPELTTDDYPNQTSRTCTPLSAISSSSSKSNDHKRRKLDVSDHVLQVCEKLLSEEKEDEFDVMGRNFANKLRRLSEEMQFTTEKLIIDILYQASIGNVNQHSTVIINNSVNSTAGTIVVGGNSISLNNVGKNPNSSFRTCK